VPGGQSMASGADLARLVLAVVFSLVGVAGIYLMTRYRPSGAIG